MSLAPVWRIGDLDLTAEPYLVRFGADHGSPENVTDILQSLLQDGDIELSTRTGNRTLMLPVLIEGADMVVLAEAEAALVAECDKVQNDLYVDPGDGFGAPMVFTVFRGQMVFARDDDYEQAGYRGYTLTCRALPYPRSTSEVVTTALVAPGSPTSVVIDDGSSTTGWAASHTLSTSGGQVKSTSGALSGSVTSTLTRTISAVNMSTTPYLLVDWFSSGDWGPGGAFRAYADGVQLTLVASGPVTGGFTRSIFACPDTSVTVFSYQSDTSTPLGLATVRVLSIDQHVRTDDPRLSTGTTARQSSRALTVTGSARTQGTLIVEHETSSLGDTQVYTFRDDGRGYSPRLRQFLTSSGTTTSDATLVSGASNSLNTQMVFDVPAASLTPGGHLLRARLVAFGSGGTETLTCTARVRINSTDVGPVVTWNTPVTVLSGAGGYTDCDLGRVILPTIDLGAASAAMVRITIVDANVGSGLLVLFDEGWIYNLEIGALTEVACGTASPASGGPSKRLYILPATVDKPRPSVLRGHAADRSDAFYPGTDVKSWMPHQFVPSAMAVFVVTSNALDPAVSLRHYPRWHSHAVS